MDKEYKFKYYVKFSYLGAEHLVDDTFYETKEEAQNALEIEDSKSRIKGCHKLGYMYERLTDLQKQAIKEQTTNIRELDFDYVFVGLYYCNNGFVEAIRPFKTYGNLTDEIKTKLHEVKKEIEKTLDGATNLVLVTLTKKSYYAPTYEIKFIDN